MIIILLNVILIFILELYVFIKKSSYQQGLGVMVSELHSYGENYSLNLKENNY